MVKKRTEVSQGMASGTRGWAVHGEAEEVSFVMMGAWQGDRVLGHLGDFTKIFSSHILVGPRLPSSHGSDLSMKSW